jgi:hypothetical protein
MWSIRSRSILIFPLYVRYIRIFADCGTNQRIREHRLYAPEKPGHGVGPLAWGCNRTARHLFASTEPNDVGCLVGYHCFFDVDTQKRFSLNVHESGDALALDPSGNLRFNDL